MAVPAFPSEQKKTQYRYVIIEGYRGVTCRAHGAWANDRFVRIRQPENTYIHETADGHTEKKYHELEYISEHTQRHH